MMRSHSNGALSGKMRGLVPPQITSKRFFQVKTYSDNSINKCDHFCISCQDILSVLSSGDLGFYALSAKDYIDDCNCSLITRLSGSSVSEAFIPPSQERELARSSSSSGEEVSRARADLLMPATPESISVIISSFGRTRATASLEEVLWLRDMQGPPPRPSLTTDDSGSPGGNPVPNDQIGQCSERMEGPGVGSLSFFLGSAHAYLCKSSPTEAGLNIPDPVSLITCGDKDQPKGTIDPSFKMKSESTQGDSLDSSATRNQYASFPTSKHQAAGKPGRYGFVSLPKSKVKFNRWGIPLGLGLCGGGESAANGWGGANPQPSGWGNTGNNQSSSQAHWGGGANRSSGPQSTNSPQSANLKPNPTTSNNSQPPASPANPQNNPSVNSSSQQGPSNNQQQQQQSNHSSGGNQPGNSSTGGSWAQAAGKGLSAGAGNGSSDAQKLQNIKEALLSSEGWGGENVNQETSWDLPSSPEPGKEGAPPNWKINMNNGCDLWENNLRNGGAVPQKPPQAPWGQNPITNYGGTWGEEDESSDSSNVWTGSTANPPHWGASSQNPPWGNGPPKKTPEWGQHAAGWGEHGPQRTGVEGGTAEWGPPHKPGPPAGPHPPPHAAPHPGQHPGPQHPGPHAAPPHPGTHPPGPHHVNHPVNHPSPHPVSHPGPHGPAPHGPTQHGPPAPHGPAPPHGPGPHGPGPHGPGPYASGPHGPGPHGPGPHTMPPAGGPAQWPGAAKELKPTGWEEPAPPSGRKDDGTAVWGNPREQSNVSRWKEMPNPNMMGRPGMAGGQQGRLPVQSLPGGPMKSDQRMWPQQPGRNGSWGEAPHDTGNALFSDETKQNWGDPTTITSPSWVTKPKTPTGGAGPWQEQDTGIELGPWNPQKKKEELEAALRDEAQMDLGVRGGGAVAGAGGDVWRNQPLEDHATTPFSELGNHSFPQRFPHTPHQQLPVNSQLQQQQQQQSGNVNPPQQLRLLMNHIQLAVQAGYLNPQILNQPLAPNSLMVLNNMLSEISLLQKLMQQHSLHQNHAHLNKNHSTHLMQLNIHIAKTKQQIQNLQNQIMIQQATYVKQQAQQQQAQQQHQQQQPHPHINSHLSGGGPPNNVQEELFKTSLPDHLYASFNQLAVAETPGMHSGPQQHQQQQLQQQHQQQQPGSRLNQWKKMPVLDNDESLGMNSDFVRAPGKPALPQSQSSPNLNPLLSGTNSAWSLSNRSSDSGWPDTDGGSSPIDKGGLGGLGSSWGASAPTGAASYGLDIKPFEPGKQWMEKNIEDDPNITPGSVTRSPLSLGIKDSDLLNSITKTSTSNTMSEMGGAGGPLTSLSLSSNTWSFNPGAGQPSSSSALSSDSKLGMGSNNKSSTWSEGPQGTTALTSELWGAPGNKTRGPPPGMSGTSNGAKQPLGGNGSTWGGIGRSTSWSGDQQRNPNSALHSASPSNPWPNSQMPSTWLLLKNLTPQIDGSTLKTLCMQHGPLVNFHLFLNNGLALVNYGSREEAVKAQGHLNNCILSNTTILAEFTTDGDVKQMLGPGAPPTPGSQATSWGGSGRGSTPTSQANSNSKVDSWASGNGSSLWGNGPSGGASSLWGAGGNLNEGDQHRATPSSLKSYLPDGLLTSESM